MGITSIEWTDRSVNPIRARLGDAVGHYCEKVSAGCAHCYASQLQPRFGMPPFETQRRGNVQPFFDATRLQEVLKRRKPTRWFWCDMTDLFGPWVPDAWIDQCFAVMALTPQHTHQILTKRPEQMREYLKRDGDGVSRAIAVLTNATPDVVVPAMNRASDVNAHKHRPGFVYPWPLPNVWLGVSCEDQPTADARIPVLLETPAAVRFVSAEPLLGPVDLDRLYSESKCDGGGLELRWDSAISGKKFNPWADGDVECKRLDWVIVGGESGPNPRPCDVAWIRRIVEQCRAAGTAVFVKQVGSNIRDRNDAGWDATSHVWADGDDAGEPVEPRAWPDHIRGVEHNPRGWREEYQGAPVRVLLHSRKGGDPSEWPADLRVREFPEVAG